MQTTQAPAAAPVGARRPGGEAPAKWRTGVSTVQTMPPLFGFPPERRRQVQQDAARLLAEHGAELHGLGWSAADVFGVHPVAPGVAVHCAGLAVVLGGARLVEVTPEHAVLVRPSGARLTYVRRPVSEAVPLWELGRDRARSGADMPCFRPGRVAPSRMDGHRREGRRQGVCFRP